MQWNPEPLKRKKRKRSFEIKVINHFRTKGLQTLTAATSLILPELVTLVVDIYINTIVEVSVKYIYFLTKQ